MNNNKLNILITRPIKPARVLAGKLEHIGHTSMCQPLFDYQALADRETTQQLIKSYPNAIVIFISNAAVEYANQAFELSQWHSQQFIAVGSATQATLKRYDIDALIPEMHTSEGILNLGILASLDKKDVIIVRGDGGREHLAEQLQQRGANVHYLESYQRVWHNLTPGDVQQWQNNAINCIVVTSNALLDNLAKLIKDSAGYWKNDCLWIVASQRIANNATQLGLNHVINANGASDEAIMTAISLTEYGNIS